MAKKTKNSFPEEETSCREEQDIPAVDTPTQEHGLPVREAEVQPEPGQPAQSAVKKRVRIRKKATKHLSVAVLCANPVTRRFI